MMKSGLAPIHQTLTLEPSVILNRSITEASRRNHAQTTPLHVAATLLSSPTGFLRQACLTSHPNSSHPLQCRALDLCFRVALERLPSAPHKLPEPPLSNALTAALKRAQAHQRRGFPENQQQPPLLAVKVELEQLIISILDDPSVSKVMREASFSSPAVKSAIEQSMMMVNSSSPVGNRFLPPPAPPSPIANLYLSPRLKQGSSGEQRSDEAAKRVIEIMMRRKKRNPILVGDEEPAAILKEVVRRIEKEGLLKNAEVIPFPLEKQFAPEKNQIPIKIKELAAYLIESSRIRTSNNRGIVLDLGDLRWLVEEAVSENGRAAVAEMRKLISSIGEEDGLWLIGTANCETYLRCQVYHASLERDWDVQAVPIAASKLSSRLLQGIIPSSRVGMYGNHNPYINPLIPLKRSTMALPALVPDKEVAVKCCPMCFKNYELDLKEKRNSSSASEVAKQPPPLPRWLQNAKAHTLKDHFKEKNEDDQIFMQKLEEQLQMKWSDKCSLVHPNFHHNVMASKSPKYQQKLQTTTILGQPTLQLSVNLSPPASPVKTDLVLGTEKTSMDCINGCISSELLTQKSFAKREDLDLFKKLLKSLLETSWWQKQAASELATTVTRSRSRNGKRRDGATKGDLWLLFAGPDRISKKRMAYAVAEQICESKPIVVCLGVGSSRVLYNEEEEEEEKSEVRLRGKTALDRIVEAVRKNPNSVIVLEDIDEADMLVCGSIKSAMERGRLTDSHGREISLGNIIFILTAKPSDELIRNVEDPVESKYGMKCNWQLQLSIKDRCNKRRANWLDDDDEDDRAKMPRTIGRHGLSLDLNLLADAEEDHDVVTECEEEEGIEKRKLTMTTVPHELTIHLDGTIVFKPVDFGVIRREIESRIKDCFAGAVGKEHTIELEGAAIEKLVGESWLGRIRFIDWMEKLLFPSFEQIKSRFSDERTTVVRLQLDGDCGSDQQGQVRLMALDDDDDV